MTAAKGREGEDRLLRIEAVHDPSRECLKIMLNGSLPSMVVLLSLIETLKSDTR